MRNFKKYYYAVIEGRLWQCICEDDDVGVFAKCCWNKNGEMFTNYEQLVSYSNDSSIIDVYNLMKHHEWGYVGDSLEDAMNMNWGDL